MVENWRYAGLMWPIFADPKTDFIFKLIFGTEAHRHLLVELLNALLELEGDRLIRDVTYLTPEQSLSLAEMKLSIVDVKCRDERGRSYVVEMQLLNVAGFEKRIVYNASKAYVMQLPSGEAYRDLCPVIGVTICDFVFWPESDQGSPVPMLSRWRMQEQRSGALGLSDVQYVFVELPKYSAGNEPETMVDRWAYFFREAENFEMVPSALQDAPFRTALEVARMAHLTPAELDAYDLAKMSEQDARGALSLARDEGRNEGRDEGRNEERSESLRRHMKDLCQALELEWNADREAAVGLMNLSELTGVWQHMVREKNWP